MMQRSDDDAPLGTDAATYFSIADLRREHSDLLQRYFAVGQKGDAPLEDIRGFIEKTRNAGVTMFKESSRDAAQSMLDFWATELIDYSYSPSGGRAPVLLSDPHPDAMPDLASVESPYVGLETFAASQAKRFFGRDSAVRALEHLLEENRVVVVSGPSGSGKSSLIMAGLLPDLEAQSANEPGWNILPIVVPGTDPLDALSRMMVTAFPTQQESAEALRKKLLQKPRLLKDLISEHSAQTPSLLIVDQFEELFTLVRDDRWADIFCRAVLNLRSQDKVVITVREDFFNAAMAKVKASTSSSLDEDFFNAAMAKVMASTTSSLEPAVFRPKPLTVEELRQVIEMPAQSVGLEFDDGIVNELVRDVYGEPAALPLLQFTLKRLWESKDRNRITWEIYRDKVGSPREALGRAADEVYRGIPEGRECAQRIFNELVEPSVGAEFLRRRASRDALYQLEATDRVERVLEKFVKAGLIRRTAGADRGSDMFEVTHEALIRNWPTLTEWLDGRRKKDRNRLQFEELARLWRESGQSSAYLLDGEALVKAAEFQSESDEIAKLIVASKRHEDELKQSGKRKSRIAIVTLSSLVLLASLGGYFGFREAAEAKEKSVLASLSRTEAEKAYEELKRTVGQQELTLESREQAINQIIDETYKIENASDLTEAKAAAASIISIVGGEKTALDNQKAVVEKLNETKNQIGESIKDISASATETSQIAQPTVPRNYPPELNCRGAIWIGSEGNWKLRELNEAEGFHLSRIDDPYFWSNRKVTTATTLRLREGRPMSAEKYLSADRIGTVRNGTVVTAEAAPFSYERLSGVQYWLPVSVSGEACATVYVQYSGGSAMLAAELASLFADMGYNVLGEEPVRDGDFVAEIRYFHESDEALARRAAIDLRDVLQHMAVQERIRQAPPVKVNDLSLRESYRERTDKRTLEIWISLP